MLLDKEALFKAERLGVAATGRPVTPKTVNDVASRSAG
jgi:hypothetical protein